MVNLKHFYFYSYSSIVDFPSKAKKGFIEAFHKNS